MTVRDLSALFEYDLWATERLLDAAEALPPELYTRPLGGGFSTVQGTLAHVIGAGWAWLHRWQGTSPTGRPAWLDDPSVAVLRTQARHVHAARATFLGTLSDPDLDRTAHYTFLSGQPGKGPLGVLMLHVVNHGTHHRGQIAAMLRQLGTAPPGLDLILFPGAYPPEA